MRAVQIVIGVLLIVGALASQASIREARSENRSYAVGQIMGQITLFLLGAALLLNGIRGKPKEQERERPRRRPYYDDDQPRRRPRRDWNETERDRSSAQSDRNPRRSHSTTRQATASGDEEPFLAELVDDESSASNSGSNEGTERTAAPSAKPIEDINDERLVSDAAGEDEPFLAELVDEENSASTTDSAQTTERLATSSKPQDVDEEGRFNSDDETRRDRRLRQMAPYRRRDDWSDSQRERRRPRRYEEDDEYLAPESWRYSFPLRVILIVIGTIGGLFACFGVFQFILAFSDDYADSPYRTAYVVASIVPVCLGLIVSLVCFQRAFLKTALVWQPDARRTERINTGSPVRQRRRPKRTNTHDRRREGNTTDPAFIVLARSFRARKGQFTDDHGGRIIASRDAIYIVIMNSPHHAMAAGGGIIGGLIAAAASALSQSKPCDLLINLQDLPEDVIEHPDWPLKDWRDWPVIVVPRAEVKRIRYSWWLTYDVITEKNSFYIGLRMFGRRKVLTQLREWGWDDQSEALGPALSAPVADPVNDATSPDVPAAEPSSASEPVVADVRRMLFDFGDAAPNDRSKLPEIEVEPSTGQSSPIDERNKARPAVREESNVSTISERKQNAVRNGRRGRLFVGVVLAGALVGAGILAFKYWQGNENKPTAQANGGAESIGQSDRGSGVELRKKAPSPEIDKLPIVKKDPEPIVKKDPEPIIEKDPEPIIKKDPEPIIKKDPDNPNIKKHLVQVPKTIPVKRKPTDKIEAIWKINQGSLVDSLVFAPDSERIVLSPGYPPEIRIYETARGHLLDKFTVPNSLSVSFLIVCSNDLAVIGNIRTSPSVWDLSKKSHRTNFENGVRMHYPGAVIQSDNTILVPKQQGGVEVFSLEDGKKLRTLSFGGASQAYRMACTYDGELIVAVVGGTISVKLPGSNESLQVARNNFERVRVAPDAKHFLATQSKPTAAVRVWSTNPIRELCTLEGHEAAITEAKFTPDGRHVLTICRDKKMRYWDLTGKLIEEIALPGQGIAMDISPDGEFAVTTNGQPQALHLWRLPGGDTKFKLAPSEP